MKTIKKIVPFGLMAMPFFVSAEVTSIMTLIAQIEMILRSLVPVIIAFAVVVLLIAIVNYIRAGEDEEKRGKAKNLMIYGIIGLFVMVSLWGLVNILKGTFGFSEETVSTGHLLPEDL